jgi:hypothetical protein
VLSDKGCVSDRRPSPQCCWPPAPGTPSPGATTRRRTARSRGSAAPSSTSGPTCVPTARSQLGAEPLTPGCTGTTITGTTPPLVARP